MELQMKRFREQVVLVEDILGDFGITEVESVI